MPEFIRDGVRLHYELDGSGPPVVLISGFSAHSEDLSTTLLRYRLAQRYTVLVVDNRGSGQTLVHDGAAVTIEDMADDIAAVIEHLQLSAVHTLGISMGGCVALMLSLRHPTILCSQVVAVSLAYAPESSRSGFILETIRLMRDAKLPLEFINRVGALALLDESIFENAQFMNAWLKAPRDPYEQTRVGYDQQVNALRHYDLRARLPSVTTPTLVISSPDDLLVPPHFQREIAELVPGAVLKHYPGGHGFMSLPMYVDQFLADVAAFWNEHS